MNFDEAYAQMRQGAAIARPHWKKIAFLFWGRENVWIAYKSGRLQPLCFFNGALSDATDWFVVRVDELPALPDPKPKSVAKRRLLGERLQQKQERMRARYARR